MPVLVQERLLLQLTHSPPTPSKGGQSTGYVTAVPREFIFPAHASRSYGCGISATGPSQAREDRLCGRSPSPRSTARWQRCLGFKREQTLLVHEATAWK